MLAKPIKAVMLISQKDFRDEELFDTKSVLEQNNIDVRVAAPSNELATGKLGAIIQPNLSFSEIEPARFNAIILIGGPGAYDLIDNASVHELILKFHQSKKILAAICIAPAILARAGLLRDKKATIHPSGQNYLEEAGAIYTEADIERDGNIITANGPAVASMFGQAIVDQLLPAN